MQQPTLILPWLETLRQTLQPWPAAWPKSASMLSEKALVAAMS